MHDNVIVEGTPQYGEHGGNLMQHVFSRVATQAENSSFAWIDLVFSRSCSSSACVTHIWEFPVGFSDHCCMEIDVPVVIKQTRVFRGNFRPYNYNLLHLCYKYNQTGTFVSIHDLLSPLQKTRDMFHVPLPCRAKRMRREPELCNHLRTVRISPINCARSRLVSFVRVVC